MKDERLAYLPTDEFLENLEHKKEVYPDLVESEAERGYFEAMCQIAYMYAKGMSVKQDYQKAFKWYLEAAESGITNAQYNLGVMYLNGDVKNKIDFKKAQRWLRKAAEQGNAVAQSQLGYLYEKGLGCSQDFAKACEWYEKSVAQGEYPAQFYLGEMYYNGWGVEKNRKKAVELLTASADHGFEYAKQLLKKIHAEK